MEYIIYDTLEQAIARRDAIDEQLGLLVNTDEGYSRPFSTERSFQIIELTDGHFALAIDDKGISSMRTSKLLPNGKVNIKYDIISSQEEKNLVTRQYIEDNDLVEKLIPSCSL